MGGFSPSPKEFVIHNDSKVVANISTIFWTNYKISRTLATYGLVLF